MARSTREAELPLQLGEAVIENTAKAKVKLGFSFD